MARWGDAELGEVLLGIHALTPFVSTTIVETAWLANMIIENAAVSGLRALTITDG